MNNLPITIRTRNILVAMLVACITIVIALLTSIILSFSLVANLVMSWILTTLYAMFAFFLVDPVVNVNPVRVVEKPVYVDVVRTVEKPIIKEIQIPMENRVIEVVEKEVIREVPVERIVYQTIETPSRRLKLDIPKFNFIGSTQTKTYHKRNCKFSKMLKNKYKLHSNSKAFFKRKHYKACKGCLKK